MPTIRVVDIETTGDDPQSSEVIELGWQDVFVRGALEHPLASERGRGLTILDGPTMSELYGSHHPCPPEILAVHHIMDSERSGLRAFDRGVPGGAWLLPQDTVAFAAHNSSFEQMFLTDGGISPLTWLGLPFICTYKCALHLWPDAPKHSNQALRYWLGLEDVDAVRAAPPHRAGPDAYVTAAILQRMLETTTVDQLLEWSRQPRPMPTLTFGKYRGEKTTMVPSDYLQWVIDKSDRDAETKDACRLELRRRAEMHRQRMLPQMPEL